MTKQLTKSFNSNVTKDKESTRLMPKKGTPCISDKSLKSMSPGNKVLSSQSNNQRAQSPSSWSRPINPASTLTRQNLMNKNSFSPSKLYNESTYSMSKSQGSDKYRNSIDFRRESSPPPKSLLDDTRSQGASSVKDLVRLFSTISNQSSTKMTKNPSFKAKSPSVKENKHSNTQENGNNNQQHIPVIHGGKKSSRSLYYPASDPIGIEGSAFQEESKTANITLSDTDIIAVQTVASTSTSQTRSTIHIRQNPVVKESQTNRGRSLSPSKGVGSSGRQLNASLVTTRYVTPIKSTRPVMKTEDSVNNILNKLKQENENVPGNIETTKLLLEVCQKLQQYIKETELQQRSSGYNKSYRNDTSKRKIVVPEEIRSRIPTRYDMENLIKAAAENKMKELKAIMAEKKFDLDKCVVTDGYGKGMNPLTIASSRGNLEIVKYLLDRGANMMYAQQGGITALYMAAQNGFVECVKFMLDRGADENEEYLNQTLMYSVRGAENIPNKFQCCDKVVRLLISRGADPNYSDPYQNFSTPLLQLVKWYYLDRKNAWPIILAKIIIAARADINKRDILGNSAISLAVTRQSLSPFGGTKNSLIELLESSDKRNTIKY